MYYYLTVPYFPVQSIYNKEPLGTKILTSIHKGTYSLCAFRIRALLLVSRQDVNQVKVSERTSGTLFFTAVLTSAKEGKFG